MFASPSTAVEPSPYPVAGSPGYCTSVARNGVSIETGDPVDATKLNDIVSLGVRWVRMGPTPATDDLSHVFGAGHYDFSDFDAAQCKLADNGIAPVVNISVGPVQYNATPGTFSPASVPMYPSASDFAQWCGAVAAHEKSAFPATTRYSIPGNEINSAQTQFAGGQAQIVSYMLPCYAAIKAADPRAFVYGFELDMDGNLNAPGFVSQMVALGCKAGTCYDGIAMHLSLRYPLPSATAPCFPNTGGNYSMQCVTDIETAAQAPIHVLISETVVTIPSGVPDEATKAKAVVEDFQAFAANPTVDGVSYGNVDECALYPTGVFSGGCLISVSGQVLPAYYALQQLALADYQ